MRFTMTIEKREGVLDRVTEKGIVLEGARLSYSKWFEGERPTEASLGLKLTVLVDAGEKCSFLKRVLAIGEKVSGWSPPPAAQSGSWGAGGGRKFSPEELDLKKADGVRIARCCAVERAVDMAERGITVEKIAAHARLLEEYFLTGTLPPCAPSGAERRSELKSELKSEEVPPAKPKSESRAPTKTTTTAPKGDPSGSKPQAPEPPARAKRLESRAVNALFNEAKRCGLVAGWQDYESLIRHVLGGADLKSAYHLSPEEFAKVESHVRPRLRAVA